MTKPTRDERNRAALATDHIKDGIGRRTRRGGIVAIVGQFASTLIQLASVVIMARLLASEDFGVIAMAATVTGFVALFTDLGLSTATIQRKEIDQQTVSTLFLLNVALGIAVMLAAWALAPLAAQFYGDDRVLLVVAVMGATIPISATGAQHIALLNRRMRFLTIRLTMLAAQATGLVGGVIAAWALGLGYWSLVIAHGANAVVLTLLVWMMSPWRPSWVSDWSGVRSAVAFGANVTGSNFVTYIARQLDNILIGWRWGPGELGFYARAYGILLLPQNLTSGPISTATVPALSRLQDEPLRWRELVLRWSMIASLLVMLPAAVLIADGDKVIRLMLGTQWSPSADILFALALSIPPRAFMNANPWIHLSRGRSDRMFQWALITLPAYVGGIVIGLQWGGVGVAYGFAIVQLVIAVPSVMHASGGTPVTTWDITKSFAPSLAALLAALLASHLCTPVFASTLPTIAAELAAIACTSLSYLVALGICSLWIASLADLRREALAELKKLGVKPAGQNHAKV